MRTPGDRWQARPSRQSWQPWLSTAIRLLLAGVLGLAGALKLPDPAESVRAVRAYKILPETVVPAVGYGLPVLEVALALLLLLGLATRLSAVVSAALVLVFLGGIVSAAARGLNIDCGCFGGGGTVAAGETRYTSEIVRDLGLLMAALALARWPRSRLSLDALLAGPEHDLYDDDPAPADDRPREEAR